MKSSRTKTRHLRQCDHQWDQSSHHTLEDDITWYWPDEQMMNCTLFNNRGRNHLDCATFDIWWDVSIMIPSHYDTSGKVSSAPNSLESCRQMQYGKTFWLVIPAKNAFLIDSWIMAIMLRFFSKEMQNVGDDASASSFRCSVDEIHGFTSCGLHDLVNFCHATSLFCHWSLGHCSSLAV